MNQIKNILFDLGGVILDIDRERCVKAFADLGFPQAGRLLGDYEQSGLFGALESGLITPADFRNELRTFAGIPLTDRQIDDALCRFLIGIPTERLRQLEQLRRHHRIFMLSNTNRIMWDEYIIPEFRKDGHDMGHYFDGTVTSFEAHVCKPHPDIFRFACRKLGITPGDTIFLDDSQANCQASEALGFSSLHITSDGGFFQPLQQRLCL